MNENSMDSNSLTTENSCDPSLLPLAARRALFEPKINGTIILDKANVTEALTAFRKIDELPKENGAYYNLNGDDSNCDFNSADYDHFISSEDESSHLSSENNSFVTQSTRLYPELPQLEEISLPCDGSDNKSPEFHLISPINRSDEPSPIESPTEFQVESSVVVNTCISPPVQSNSHTPLRTLSMYRREQKFRNLSKMEDSEDSFDDLETENLKNQLIEMYIDSRAKKLNHLKMELEKYNNIIYQSSRALELCVQTNNVSERLEAEKILLVNVVKKTACEDELSRLQSESIGDIIDDPIGKVTFNKLTIPVKGSFFASQAIGNDSHDYNFICLFICGDKVIATETLSSNHSIREASLSFSNQIVFDNLRENFKIRLNVYVMASAKSKRNHDKKITSKSFRITPKTRPKSNSSLPSIENSECEKNKSNFKLVGYVDFTRENLFQDTFHLSKLTCPDLLENLITIDSQIGVDYNIKFSSYLNFHETSGDYPVWNRRWCLLDGPSIYYWRYAEDEGTKQPMGSICLKQCVNPTISKATSDICMRSYSFSFLTFQRKENSFQPVRYLMAADIRKERDIWLDRLNKVLTTIRIWEKDARQPMDQISLDRAMK